MSNKSIYTQFHYVYRITNLVNNKHYYGKRSSKLEPKLDLGVKYFSSSTDKEFIKEQKTNPHNFKYKVIKTFDSAKEALALEVKLHDKFNVGVNQKFYNRAKQTSTKVSTNGKTYEDRTRYIGANNGSYGTIWIHNSTTLERRKIKKDQPLPDGWAVGGSPPPPNDLTEDHIKRGVTVADLGKAKSMLAVKNKGMVLAKEFLDKFIGSNAETITELANFLGCSQSNLSQLLKKHIKNYNEIFQQGKQRVNKQLLPTAVFKTYTLESCLDEVMEAKSKNTR